MKTSQSLEQYFNKAKHNGIKWAAGDILKRFFEKVFRIKDNNLIIYDANLAEMPLFDSKLKGVEFKWIPSEDKSTVLALDDWQLGEKKYDEYIGNGSECLGAFYQGTLVAYTWAHFEKFEFSSFKYTLHMKDNEAYAGPDFVAPEYRGNGLQPAILTHAAAEMLKKNYDIGLGSIMQNNLASKRGVAKAGPKPIREIRVVRFYKYIVHRKLKEYR